MSGRRRRGRRRPWEPRDGSAPSPPRSGPDGQPNGPPPPRGFGGYTGSSFGGPSRWQGPAAGGQAQRRGGNARFDRARFGEATPGGAPNHRRWGPGQGQGGGQQRYGGQPRPRGGGRPQGRPQQSYTERREPPPAVPPGGQVDPFELFCAYHLGITLDGGYRIQNIHEVARRFGTNAGALRQTLAAYGMDADDIVHSGFDLPSAQIDIMVAPAGISRKELARPLYEEFKSAPRKARDWAKEMEEADREIQRTIGQDGRWSPPPRDRAGKQS